MKPLYQFQHDKINAVQFPGTRQICSVCGEPTDKCEEDGYFDSTGYAYCEGCFIGGWNGG